MQHAVGFFSGNPGYRDGYCAPTSGVEFDSWQQLVGFGLAKEGQLINNGTMQNFFVTDEGKKAIGLPEQMRAKASSDDRVKRSKLYFLQELVGCGAYESDDVECHGFTLAEVNDFDPVD